MEINPPPDDRAVGAVGGTVPVQRGELPGYPQYGRTRSKPELPLTALELTVDFLAGTDRTTSIETGDGDRVLDGTATLLVDPHPV